VVVILSCGCGSQSVLLDLRVNPAALNLLSVLAFRLAFRLALIAASRKLYALALNPIAAWLQRRFSRSGGLDPHSWETIV